jgi:hypothetical protein
MLLGGDLMPNYLREACAFFLIGFFHFSTSALNANDFFCKWDVPTVNLTNEMNLLGPTKN